MFSLWMNPELREATKYPEVTYDIYDPAIRGFAVVHSRAWFSTGHPAPLYWIIKRHGINMEDCPDINKFIDEIQKTATAMGIGLAPTCTPSTEPGPPTSSPVPSSVDGESGYDSESMTFNLGTKRKYNAPLISIGTVNIKMYPEAESRPQTTPAKLQPGQGHKRQQQNCSQVKVTNNTSETAVGSRSRTTPAKLQLG